MGMKQPSVNFQMIAPCFTEEIVTDKNFKNKKMGKKISIKPTLRDANP
jgi:phosphotransferase system IIA component